MFGRVRSTGPMVIWIHRDRECSIQAEVPSTRGLCVCRIWKVSALYKRDRSGSVLCLRISPLGHRRPFYTGVACAGANGPPSPNDGTVRDAR